MQDAARQDVARLLEEFYRIIARLREFYYWIFVRGLSFLNCSPALFLQVLEERGWSPSLGPHGTQRLPGQAHHVL